MSEHQPGALADLDALPGALPMSVHPHHALSGAAIAPTSRLAARGLEVRDRLVVGDRDVAETLARQVPRADARVAGDLIVSGRVRAASLDAARPPTLWRAPTQDRPAVYFGRQNGGYSQRQHGYEIDVAAVPATGPGRLLVLLLWIVGSGEAGQTVFGRLALQLVLLGPRGGRSEELLIPLALGELPADERAALAAARDFAAWRAARPGDTRGGWTALDRCQGVEQGVNWAAGERSASLAIALPAPQRAARVELLRDADYARTGTNHLLQVVYLPARAP